MGNYPVPEDIGDYIRRLEARIERLERAPRAVATSIDTGEFVVKDPATGNVVFRIGLQQHGDTGVSMYRDDGSLAYSTAKPFNPSNTQTVRLVNRAGETVGGDNIFATTGAALYDSITPTKTSDVGVGVTSGTFVDIYDVDVHWIAPAHSMLFRAICSDGSTAGEVRMVDETGTQVGGFFVTIDPTVVPAGTTTATEFETLDGTDPYYVVKAIGTKLRYKLQARRTAGAGTLTVKALYYKQRPF